MAHYTIHQSKVPYFPALMNDLQLLYFSKAEMAELVDALDSKSSEA